MYMKERNTYTFKYPPPYVTGTYLGIECVKFTNFLITFSSLLRQTQYIEMMTREGPTKTVDFVTPGAMFLVPVRGHTSHVLKIHHFFHSLFLYFRA